MYSPVASTKEDNYGVIVILSSGSTCFSSS